MKEAEKEIRQLEKDLIAAVLRRDAEFIERILADEVTVITPFGDIVGKNEMTRFDEKLVNESIEIDEIRVHVFDKTAVVTGRATIKSRYENQDLSGRYRFTRVYLMRRSWQIIAYQATRMAEDLQLETPLSNDKDTKLLETPDIDTVVYPGVDDDLRRAARAGFGVV